MWHLIVLLEWGLVDLSLTKSGGKGGKGSCSKMRGYGLLSCISVWNYLMEDNESSTYTFLPVDVGCGLSVPFFFSAIFFFFADVLCVLGCQNFIIGSILDIHHSASL